jgi:hypothetical protein
MTHALSLRAQRSNLIKELILILIRVNTLNNQLRPKDLIKEVAHGLPRTFIG